MKQSITGMIVSASAAFVFGGSLYAVVDTRPEQPVAEEAIAEEPVGEEAQPSLEIRDTPMIAKINVPVNWQMTRARFRSEAGASTHTESYREVWTLEIGQGGVLRLQSPRAVVAIHRSESQAVAKQAFLPETVVLLQSDFARLIGIPGVVNNDEAEVEPLENAPLLVTLHIGRHPKADEMIFSISEVEHVAVQFEVGETIHY